uniref:PsbP C-terminal domain-containing protein n=1 Tax=Ditylum brightwellii TaxID=49249 RepID=A0A7S1YTF4_9STRA|mmetsp:Transcript_17074/g.25342  ORF Transcript_17074/g.25342 Transcript_17074/m.25342 type:complete len:245 (+) Transcript_17074:147-881(+)
MHSRNCVRWTSTLLVVTAVSTTTGVSAFLVPSLQPSVCYGTRPGDIGWGHRCQTQHKLFVKKLPSSLPSLSRLCSSPENDNEVKLLPTKENVIASTTNEEEVQQQSKSDSKTNGTPSSQPAPTAKELMNAMGTTPRRIFLSLLSSTFIALIANFVGVTSALLGSIPEDLVEQTGLDGYYPRGGFKRFRSGEYGYTVLLPKEWVADTAVELAKATRRTKMLDYSMKKSGGGVIPDAGKMFLYYFE